MRPLQDKVAQAAKTCDHSQLQGLKDQVNGVSKQLDQLCGVIAGAALFQAFRGAFDAQRAPQAPACGCMAPPTSPEQGVAPAGKGLSTSPPGGWPANAVRTAGGYTIVPEGKDAAWSIYSPEQGPQDKPTSRIWGDPHVNEADGGRWDFSKSSQFRLPDGTSIDVQTTAETGHSLCATLNITNGNDHVTVSGVNGGKPTLSPISQDGFAYRASSESKNPNRDTFTLGGTNREADGADRVQWEKSNGGVNEGVITGSTYDGSYHQTVDANKAFTIDPSLRPDPVRQQAAWGNMLRGELAQAAGDLPPGIQDFVVNALATSDAQQRQRGGVNQVQQAIQDIYGQSACGGMASVFQQNPLQGVTAAATMFSTLFRQIDLGSALSQNLSLNRGLFV